MKRLLVIITILLSISAFQNCSAQFTDVLKNAVGNGEPHQGIDGEEPPPPPPREDTDVDRPPASTRPPQDTDVNYYALADETNGCGGATTKAVRTQAIVRITPQGLSWEKHDCLPAGGKSADGVIYFEARTFNAAVIQSKLVQASKVNSASFSRIGLYDVFCTNAPGDVSPGIGKPIVEILLQKQEETLAAEPPGRSFKIGDALNLKRKVHVRILRDRLGPISKYAINSANENRPKGALAVTAGNPKTTGNYINLTGKEALLKKDTAAQVSVRVGTETFKNLGLRCYRNRNNL